MTVFWALVLQAALRETSLLMKKLMEVMKSEWQKMFASMA